MILLWNFFLSMLLLGMFTGNSVTHETVRYDLNNPIARHTLPAILNEVSGLTDIDSVKVAVVQDELGTVFVYNFRTGKIISKHVFDSTGDFEGLTFTGSALYILRSDGRLSEWSGFPEVKGQIKHYHLPLLTNNNEGLCYDEKHSRILIGAKNKPLNNENKSSRYVYAFDLGKKQLLEKPLYDLNTEQIGAKALDLKLHSMETNAKGKVKPFNFRPSSLAVHPITDNIYVISAVDRLLIVINRKGEIIQIDRLNASRFLKAEGITFLKDGTMIITNEAAGKVPDLMVFGMEKR